MGRRKRSRSSDEGDDLEAFERSWLDQRKKSVKQHQVDEHHVKEKESATPVDAKLQKEAGRDGASINNVRYLVDAVYYCRVHLYVKLTCSTNVHFHHHSRKLQTAPLHHHQHPNKKR
jgi:hypothetical protein